MKSGKSPVRIRDVGKVLDTLRGLYEQLLESLHARRDALRRADLARMSSLSETELLITKKLGERLGFRRQLMEKIGLELGFASREARSLSVSQLAARIDQGERAPLLEAAKNLRTVVFQVSQANRVLASATRELLHHLRWVTAAVRPSGESPVAYSRAGTWTPTSGTRFVEIVG